MQAAIVLRAVSFGTSGPVRWNAADVAVHNNNGYLEEYVRGPGRGWFVLGQTPCAPKKNCVR